MFLVTNDFTILVSQIHRITHSFNVFEKVEAKVHYRNPVTGHDGLIEFEFDSENDYLAFLEELATAPYTKFLA
jgi:hypothetical protein